MMMSTTNKLIYAFLQRLGIVGPEGDLRENGRSQSRGFMDLVYERLEGTDGYLGRGGAVISLAHYFKQNGDLCQDPEMVILVHPNSQVAEAFSYQQAIPPIYQEVYSGSGRLNVQAKIDLDSFLVTWLKNLVDQGHGFQT